MTDTPEQKKAYRRVDGECCDEYEMLIGPNGFECCLTEPEDRTWYRDGQAAIVELNRLHAEVERLSEFEELVEALQEFGVDNWEGYGDAMRSIHGDDDND